MPQSLDVLTTPRDTGYQPSELTVTDYRYGAMTGIVDEKLSDGSPRYWQTYLPIFEAQSNGQFDDMGCVSRSKLNVIETLGNRKYPEEKHDLSDRFLAMMSGTTVTGNSAVAVNKGYRRFGVPPEFMWPFPQGEVTWPMYYQRPPDSVIRTATKFLDKWSVQHDYTYRNDPDRLIEMLRYSPLQVFVRAYGRRDDATDIYQRIEGRINHAIMLWGYEYGKYWLIYDSYRPAIKKLAWNYIFEDFVVRHSLTKRVMTPPIQENYLYQQVAGRDETDVKGGFALAIGNVLYVDEVAKLLASWMVRNNGITSGRTGTLTRAEWNEIPKKNLKGATLPNDATNP